MAISDNYVVQYLLEGTSRAQEAILWQERQADRAAFVTRVGEVQVELENAYSRAGSHLELRFRRGEDEFTIREPAGRGWLGRKYSTEDEGNLAHLLRSLLRAASLQCRHRRLHALQNADQIRERVYHHLLFGEPAVEQSYRTPGR